MSETDDRSRMSEPSEQVSAPKEQEADTLEADLLKKWKPGTPLERKVADEVAKAHRVSPTAVYKARKRLSLASAAPSTEAREGGGLTLRVEANPKAGGTSSQQPATGTAAAPSVVTAWTTSEVFPVFSALNQLIEARGRGPAPDEKKTEELAALWAATLTAFKVPKGEAGGKYLVAGSALVSTVMVYLPYLRRKKAEETPPEPPEKEGSKE